MPSSENFTTHTLAVQRTAHYYTIGQASPEIEHLWIVCHGYGQLASHIIHKFSDFEDGKNLVVAPEGLSRFYWKGFGGAVGASWMTRADRLDEIADYCQMMQSVYDLYKDQLHPDVKIHLFGFSQGCATQCRWIMDRQPHFDNLILWAGLLPDDLDYKPQADYFSTKNIHWLYGHEDPFLTPERLEWHRDFSQKMKLDIQEQTFQGKHTVERKVLLKLKNILTRG